MRAVRSLTVGLALAVGVSTFSSSAPVTAAPVAAGAAAATAKPDGGPEPVSPHAINGLARPADPADHSANLPDRLAELPDGEGAVEASESWQGVPGLPVRVRSTNGAAGVGRAPVRVSIDRPANGAPGTMLLTLGQDSASVSGSGGAPAGVVTGRNQVEVELGYGDFRYAFAGDWGSRLRVLAFPACFVATPEVSRCAQGQAVASVNDPASETVTFTTTVTQGADKTVGAADPAQPSDTPSPSEAASPAPRARVAPFAQAAAAPETGMVYVLAASPSVDRPSG